MSNVDSSDIDPSEERGITFERYRPRLFGIAYRMLGSVDDAEDVVQDAYLRWHRAELDALRSAEAWLVTVVTRLAIDRRCRLATEREAYEGHWLPEPLATSAVPPPDQHAELASDLSIAFLVLLERLAPEERVARLAVGYERMGRGRISHRIVWINGEPAVLTLAGDRTLFTTSFALDGDRIAAVYRVLNPDKLQHVGPPPYGPWRG
jgi:RNA polymerase sigma factor (sigma-70 family)